MKAPCHPTKSGSERSDGERHDRQGPQGIFSTDDGIVLPLPDSVSRPSGTEAIYGIRPEYFTMSPTGSGIPARIVVIEPLGPETQLTATVGGQTVVTMFHERISVQPDETIWLQPQADRVCLFDTAGRRMT